MAKKKTETPEVVEPTTPTTTPEQALVSALVQAIQQTKPVEKKNPFTRKRNTPWSPKNGEARLRLKRKTYHHGQLLNVGDNEPNLYNSEIALLNQLRPGIYMDGDVRVIRRRDKGIDIDYKVRTAADRLKLVNKHGIRSFEELLTRILDEAENPVKYKEDEDE